MKSPDELIAVNRQLLAHAANVRRQAREAVLKANQRKIAARAKSNGAQTDARSMTDRFFDRLSRGS